MGVHLARWTPSFSLMSAPLSLRNQVFNERIPDLPGELPDWPSEEPLWISADDLFASALGDMRCWPGVWLGLRRLPVELRWPLALLTAGSRLAVDELAEKMKTRSFLFVHLTGPWLDPRVRLCDNFRNSDLLRFVTRDTSDSRAQRSRAETGSMRCVFAGKGKLRRLASSVLVIMVIAGLFRVWSASIGAAHFPG
jgi:hypothetical protein